MALEVCGSGCGVYGLGFRVSNAWKLGYKIYGLVA